MISTICAQNSTILRDLCSKLSSQNLLLNSFALSLNGTVPVTALLTESSQCLSPLAHAYPSS